MIKTLLFAILSISLAFSQDADGDGILSEEDCDDGNEYVSHRVTIGVLLG